MADTDATHPSAGALQGTPETERTIDQWMGLFSEVYQEVDSERTPADMWIAATAHFTHIGEAIRLMDFAALLSAATHAFCWMCSFVLRCQGAPGTVFHLSESFSGIVAAKYPLVCGHCVETPCHCKPEEMNGTSNKGAQYRRLLEKRQQVTSAVDTYSVSRWADVFRDIYGQHVHMLTFGSIGFHFLEEAGEGLTALRDLMQLRTASDRIETVDTEFLNGLSTFGGVVDLYDQYPGPPPDMTSCDGEHIKARIVRAKVGMFIEFADTFSWFCSILNKVSRIARNCRNPGCTFLDDAFYRRLVQEYLPDGQPICPTCKHCPCKCVFYR